MWINWTATMETSVSVEKTVDAVPIRNFDGMTSC